MSSNKLEKLHDDMKDFMRELAWEHWTRLGLPGSINVDGKINVDPEALLIFTADKRVASDIRLLGEVVAWLSDFEGYFFTSRVKNLLSQNDAKNETLLILGGIINTAMSGSSSPTQWNGIYNFLRENADRNGETVTLGERTDREGQFQSFEAFNVECPRLNPGKKRAEEIGERNVDPVIESNNRLWTRAVFGVNARAEIFNFFLSGGQGNSNRLSKTFTLSQTNINNILKDLSIAGVLNERRDGRGVEYSLSESVKFDRDPETFVQWDLFYNVLVRSMDFIEKQLNKDLSDYQFEKIQERIMNNIGPAHDKVMRLNQTTDRHPGRASTVFERLNLGNGTDAEV